jgi:hypothetical protein
MKARMLIEGATYGPETLKVIGKAFDDAWSEIAGHFARTGLQAESARLKLAHAVLAVARDDSRDSDELKHAALQVMALNYRDQSDPSRPVWQPAGVTNSVNMLK